MQDDASTVAELKGIIRQFVDERDWRQFHTPKDLAIGLSIEAAELLEHFRFRSEEEIKERLRETASRQAVGHELADAFLLYYSCVNSQTWTLPRYYERKWPFLPTVIP